MKRVSLLAVVLGVLVSACGSSSPAAPNTPTNPTFTATLSPANEVPAIAGAEASGSGTAVVTLVTTKDAAGNVTSATATFVVNLSGFPAGTPINIAHIHQAPAGTNGSIVFNTSLAAGEAVLANGSGSFTKAGVTPAGDPAAIINAIIANPSGFYFNVHSTLNPGGVARGQLVRVQ
jgi:hypothetical protein